MIGLLSGVTAGAILILAGCQPCDAQWHSDWTASTYRITTNHWHDLYAAGSERSGAAYDVGAYTVSGDHLRGGRAWLGSLDDELLAASVRYLRDDTSVPTNGVFVAWTRSDLLDRAGVTNYIVDGSGDTNNYFSNYEAYDNMDYRITLSDLQERRAVLNLMTNTFHIVSHGGGSDFLYKEGYGNPSNTWIGAKTNTENDWQVQGGGLGVALGAWTEGIFSVPGGGYDAFAMSYAHDYTNFVYDGATVDWEYWLEGTNVATSSGGGVTVMTNIYQASITQGWSAVWTKAISVDEELTWTIGDPTLAFPPWCPDPATGATNTQRSYQGWISDGIGPLIGRWTANTNGFKYR